MTIHEKLDYLIENTNPITSQTPYIDIRNLTSNTSNEYFDFSISSAKTASSPDDFYRAINGEGKLIGTYGWEGGSPVTVTITLKKHVPGAFLLNISGETYTPYAIATANLISYTNIDIHINGGTGRQYLFRPLCGIGESFTLTFNSGYEWSSFTDFHLRAF